MVEKFWYKVTRTFAKVGIFPFAINDELIELLRALLTEEQAKFVLNFHRSSLNIDELKAKTDIDDNSLYKMLNDLMNIGIITGIPSRRTGIMVYTLMNLLPGVFEYSFMKGETGEREKKLAHIYEKLFEKTTENYQNNYDNITNQFKNILPIERVVPVEEEVEVQKEAVLPYEDVKKLVEKFDTIAVSYCYCRHQKDLLGEHCKIDAPKLNCLQLGKNAKFAIEYGFAKQISRDEALKILREAEDVGLVHKAIHPQTTKKDEAAICNCCKCCCETFQMFYRGMAPTNSLTSYISKVDKDDCIGCGTCVEKCPMEAINLDDDFAVVNENKCIGCGVCAYHCPQNAIQLERTGPRTVFIPPPRIKQN